MQPTRRSLTITLLRAREAVMGKFRPMLAEYDVTEQQWRVLRALAEQSPLDATEACERAVILAPSLTRIIKTLEDRKLITRGKFANDGRRAQLAITPSGLALVESVMPVRRTIYDELEKRYGAAEMDRLIDMLEVLIDNQR